jgi:hypothetical protein
VIIIIFKRIHYRFYGRFLFRVTRKNYQDDSYSMPGQIHRHLSISAISCLHLPEYSQIKPHTMPFAAPQMHSGSLYFFCEQDSVFGEKGAS